MKSSPSPSSSSTAWRAPRSPLFVGWPTATECETAAVSPLEAILTNEGPDQAKFFGWSEPFGDFAAIKGKHDEAEAMTDGLGASALAEALDYAKYPAVEAGVRDLRAATP